jgi:peptidoglycan/LPS O-acetylase OafA/YrhL
VNAAGKVEPERIGPLATDSSTPAPSPARRRDPRLRGHMAPLDGVRGVAILMVLALHFVGNTVATNGLEAIVGRICTFGLFGVDLFFVLSGFLITGILIDTRGRGGYFSNFYARRALRIFPLYYGVLVVLLVIVPHIPQLAGPEVATLVQYQNWAWLYGINILVVKIGGFRIPYIDHFWSLAVEEHFYFVWPLIVWLCSRRVLARASLAIALGVLVLRALLASSVSELALYALTPFRLDALCLGGFLAAISRGDGGLEAIGRALKPVTIGAVLAFLGLYAINRVTGAFWAAGHELRSGLIVVLLAALMMAPLTAGPGSLWVRFFTASPLRTLGKYSYGLYVFHHFLSYYFVHHRTEYVVARWVGSHTLAVLLQATTGFALSLLVAVASYHGFEKHFIALKRFWSTPPPREERESAAE